MSRQGPLDTLCDVLGIQWKYHDSNGEYHETSAESRCRISAAMGFPSASPEQVAESLHRLDAEAQGRLLPLWVIAEAGSDTSFAVASDCTWQIEFENGTRFGGYAIDQISPGIIPPGIHRLIVNDHETTILAAPTSLPIPDRCWGVTLPIYGLRTAEIGGLGTYQDLKKALTVFGDKGASFVGVNPIHAGFPTQPDFYSPYAPSSRRRLNVVHIAPSTETSSDHDLLISYTHALPERMTALRRDYDRFVAGGENADFEKYLAVEGDTLVRFATHQALSERFGAFWDAWPAEYQDCDSPKVQAVARASEDELQFHCWLQWCAEQQLNDVNQTCYDHQMSQGLYLDLAVGTHPYGAETWAEPDLFAQGVSIGAPPDAFSADGQIWGLAPMLPHALAQAGFRPLAETLRKQLKFSKLLRIDHILGFARSFWVPEGGQGAYITMPRAAMLAIVRIEAARAGATIVGEDLGNIPDGLRDDLHQSGILGCRVAVFERNWNGDGHFIAAQDYPKQVLTSFATHDLPTWLGWRKARDIEWRRSVGDITPEFETGSKQGRDREVAMIDAHLGSASDEPNAMHEFLGRTNARMAALQIEDILEMEEQPNLPGTIYEHPNWRRRLPISLDDIAGDARVEKTAKIMTDTGR